MIHFTILINALIIIIILHLFISNLNDTSFEHYDEEKKEKKEKKEKSKNDLKKIDDLSEHMNNKYANKPNTITPANTFDKMDSLNVPNFESNVLDYTKFYKINQNNDDSKAIIKNKNAKSNFISPVSTPENSVSVSPRPFNSVDTGKIASRPSRGLPDRWEYANDLPMNGGMFGSIVGLDSSESLYSSFDGSAVSFKKCAEEVVARIPHNDLRKPIVYN
jgi:hypothetical protein